jgi:hypothetical protein
MTTLPFPIRSGERDVRRIVAKHLEAFGYDGLYSPRNDCGCELSDLMPCDEEGIGDCEPGVKDDCDPEHCMADGECPWHIVPREKTG